VESKPEHTTGSKASCNVVGDTGYRTVADHPTVVRLYRFGVVGASAALVQTVVLWALVEHGGLDYLTAAVLSIELTIILQFVANNAWTFQHARYTSRFDFLVGLFRTNVVRGTAIPIQVALLYTFVNWVGLMYLIANGAAIVLSGFYRYYLDSRWTWKIA
jgi:putative flippase GtrA